MSGLTGVLFVLGVALVSAVFYDHRGRRYARGSCHVGYLGYVGFDGDSSLTYEIDFFSC